MPQEPGRQQNLRFQGQYRDRDTGLHYNIFRYYDPDIGRYISPDPIGLQGGINLGSYAPNPISWIDPWGLDIQKNSATAKNKSEPRVLSKLQSQYPKSQYEILRHPRVYINNTPNATGTGKLYTAPDFMVIERSTGDIIDLVDAKNGNADFSANQEQLNQNGGEFRGSSRSRELPKGIVPKTIPPNSLRIERTDC